MTSTPNKMSSAIKNIVIAILGKGKDTLSREVILSTYFTISLTTGLL